MYILDNFNRLSNSVVLCKPNGEPIGSLDDALDITITQSFNTLSELNLKVEKTNPFYKEVGIMKNIRVEEVGIFTISNAQETNDGVNQYKTVQAYSIERELVNKNTGQIKGTFKFYDALNTDGTILDMIIKRVPNWKIGHVDIELYNTYRTFDIIDVSLYNFMVTELEQTYGCIFKFDSFTRTINVYTPENSTPKSDIFISYSNLLKQIQIDCKEDEICTALEVTGGGDLDIRQVNPMGNNFIYDYSYFLNGGWFTDSLSSAYVLWKNKLDSQVEPYSTLLRQLKQYQIELLQLNIQLTELESDKKALLQAQSIAIENNNQADVGNYNQQIKAKDIEIKNKKTEIDNKEMQIENTQSELITINQSVSFENNFTQEQLLELQLYTKEQSFQEPNIIKTSEMTDEQIMDNALELYNQGERILSKLSKVRYSFSGDVANFLTMPQFSRFSNQLTLGSKMILELDTGFEIFSKVYKTIEEYLDTTIEDMLDVSMEDLFYEQVQFVEPVLLQVQWSLTDPSLFHMTWGDRLRLPNEFMDFEELMGKTVNTTTNVDGNGVIWGEWINSGSRDEVIDFVNSPLDAAKNELLSSDRQAITVGDYGLKAQRKIEGSEDEYEPYQAWLTGKVLGFTKDGWNSSETALGEVTLPNGEKSYGLVAKAIMGNMIFGNQLAIQNDGGTITLDSNGYTSTTLNQLGRVIMNPTNGFAIQSRNNTNEAWKNKVWLDASGNALFDGDIIGGTMNINNKFKVDANGNVVLDGSITWGASNSPVKVQYSVNGTSGWHDIFQANDLFARYSYDGGRTWTQAVRIVGKDGQNGSDANLPSYIKETKITGTTVESCTLRGNTIIAGDTNGVHMLISDTSPFTVYRDATKKKAIELWSTSDASSYLNLFKANGDDMIRLVAARSDASTSSMFIESPFTIRTYNDSPIKIESEGSMQLTTFSNNINARPYGGTFAVTGDITANGVKPATVKTDNFGWRQLYAEESDRLYFNTYGNSKTELDSNGRYRKVIKIEDIFFETIEPNSVCPYNINLTPYSLCTIACVKKYDKYIVVESSEEVEFDYSIRCTRKNYKDTYIEEVGNVFREENMDDFSIKKREIEKMKKNKRRR